MRPAVTWSGLTPEHHPRPAPQGSVSPRWRILVIAAIVVLLVGVGAVVVPRLMKSTPRSMAMAAATPMSSAPSPLATSTPPSPSSSVATSPVVGPVPATTPIGPTTGPGAVFPGANLTTAGLGPLTFGMSLAAFKQGGYLVPSSEACVPAWVANPDLFRDGVTLYMGTSLEEIRLTNATYATRSGARVGMTVKDLRSLYGANLTIETKNGDGGAFQAPIVRAGDREVAFVPEETPGTPFEASKITEIISRAWLSEIQLNLPEDDADEPGVPIPEGVRIVRRVGAARNGVGVSEHTLGLPGHLLGVLKNVVTKPLPQCFNHGAPSVVKSY